MRKEIVAEPVCVLHHLLQLVTPQSVVSGESQYDVNYSIASLICSLVLRCCILALPPKNLAASQEPYKHSYFGDIA